MQFVPQYDEFMIYKTLSDIHGSIDSSESLKTLEVEDIYMTCVEQFEIKECIDGKN